MAVYADSFYGAQPMRAGKPIEGADWDGMAYVVACDNGNRTIFDRSRIWRSIGTHAQRAASGGGRF